ncbi:unnamed protein product [Menidia menidia]|uniref:(Atlantic silverside) hypothetical protein n=1 Tax=Menidia menidia TaxID=238744 RepID=A0A8S4B572_9TELE|nr:unnamed protein product [Menidia menidia]
MPLHKTISHSTKPGWNDYVKEHHAEARRALKAWADAGIGWRRQKNVEKNHLPHRFSHFLLTAGTREYPSRL